MGWDPGFKEAALTMSEWKGFALAVRLELLVRDQTLVLCLKAALTLKAGKGSREAISEAATAVTRGVCAGATPEADVRGRLGFGNNRVGASGSTAELCIAALCGRPRLCRRPGKLGLEGTLLGSSHSAVDVPG